MTTSNNQRAMHRISPDNPVRRRLFPNDDITDEAKNDNFANMLQESAAREKLEKMHKWNFDFENEMPLQGTYEWYPCTGSRDWIGIDATKFETDDVIKATEDTFLQMKFENELTPKSDKDDNIPLLRKRRMEDLEKLLGDRRAKRKISFD
ncbi:PREDICTED: uncharacterized protein LOC106120675 isoform X1 [Papilio xuthus]|uniref:Uncharacterized protein LOC106120675 isoform X1 n=2 Tax=Papilio xuthus TaxID=66420 RepID=A0AAJ7EC69_PAPXU|nr:PREDICTED: uncharacterized protein LOC106120675 isoform X1 [Papilio xuthus]